MPSCSHFATLFGSFSPPGEPPLTIRVLLSLANFSLPREERRNASKLYNPMRIRDLSKYDPNTPWLEYINNILTPDIIQVRRTVHM